MIFNHHSPEEMNRRVISVLATYHFAPTQAALDNVISHGVRREQAFCTGNTVVDALRIVKEAFTHGTLDIRTIYTHAYKHAEKRHKKL